MDQDYINHEISELDILSQRHPKQYATIQNVIKKIKEQSQNLTIENRVQSFISIGILISQAWNCFDN